MAANSALVGGLLSDLLRQTDPPGLVTIAVAGAMILVAAVAFTRADARAGFLSWAMTSFGILYIGLLLPFIDLTAHLAPSGGSATTAVGGLGLRSGSAWVLLLILVVWGYDTGAYLTGRWLGRRRLIEHLSPSKTVEGMAGGLLVATLAAGHRRLAHRHRAVAPARHRSGRRSRRPGGRPRGVDAQARGRTQGLR